MTGKPEAYQSSIQNNEYQVSHTVLSPDYGHIVDRNMQRKEINIIRKIVHQVGFIDKISAVCRCNIFKRRQVHESFRRIGDLRNKFKMKVEKMSVSQFPQFPVTSYITTTVRCHKMSSNYRLLRSCDWVLQISSYVTEKYTGLFISPSGISELNCATTKTDTAEMSISISREFLQVFFVLGALAYFQVPPLGGSPEEKWRSQ